MQLSHCLMIFALLASKSILNHPSSDSSQVESDDTQEISVAGSIIFDKVNEAVDEFFPAELRTKAYNNLCNTKCKGARNRFWTGTYVSPTTIRIKTQLLCSYMSL